MSSIFDMYINEAYGGQILQEAYYINPGERIEKKGYCISEEDPRKVKNWKGESLMFGYTVWPTIQDTIKDELKYAPNIEGSANSPSMYLCKACYINDDYRATRLGDLVEEFKSLKDLAIKYKVDYTEAENRIKNKANAAQEKANKFPVEDFAELYKQASNIIIKSLEALKKNSQMKNIVREAIIQRVPKSIEKQLNRFKAYYNRPGDAELIAKIEQDAKEYIKYYSTKSFLLPVININYKMADHTKNMYKPFSKESIYPIELDAISNIKQTKYFEGIVGVIVMEVYCTQMLKETKDTIKRLKVGNFRVKSVTMGNPGEIKIENNYE
ncbi:MAG: hypothetical protein IKR19_08605 [Acholeplasmatales bacterium]|nr:hypothetical protein [Acholeplasmatales bacterium]